MNTRILIIEDDRPLAGILEASIAIGGFDGVSVGSGREAIERLRSEEFGAILMDLGLPDIDGTELIRAVRSLTALPILIVSGRGSERDKIEALDLGADDFVPKPFLPGELLARIRAALRRNRPDQRASAASEVDRNLIRLGDLILDLRKLTAEFRGRSVALTETEAKILRLLILNQDNPVSRAELLETLYGTDDRAPTKIVEVYIGRIRTKLQELTGRSDLIENRRGRGWILSVRQLAG